MRLTLQEWICICNSLRVPVWME